MKRIQLWLIIILIGCFSLLSAGNLPESGWVSLKDSIDEGDAPQTRIIDVRDDRLIIEVSIPGFYVEREMEGNEEYIRLSLPDSNHLQDIGKAELPQFGALLQFPFNSEYDAYVISRDTVTYEGVLIYPTQQMPVRSNPGFRYPFFIDSDFYGTDGNYPRDMITLGDGGVLRDVHIARLGIHPMQYNPARQTLNIHRSITVAVDINKGRDSYWFRNESEGISHAFHSLYEKLILNYGRDSRPVRAEAESMLVFVSDPLDSAVAPLLEWKHSKGIKVHKIMMSEISNTTAGIKAAIQNAYDTFTPKPSYVLLVGHSDTIVPNYRSTSNGNAASDYPYTLLDGDQYPDILIGRILAKNTGQVDVQVSKIVNYEQNPFLGTEGEFYSKAFGIASNEGSNPSDEDYINQTAGYLLGGTYTHHDYFFQRVGNATAVNISAAINEGRTYASYIGHGSGTSWSNTNTTFNVATVHALSNGFKLPVIIDVACLNGQFDGISECFGEAWMWAGTPASPKGAVAYYGGSVSVSWDPPAVMMRGIAKHHFEDPVYTFGGSCLAGQMYLVAQMGWNSNTEDNFEWYNIFGDPSLMMRTANPAVLDVDHPAIIPAGSTSVSVNVQADGSAFQGALVCIYAGNNPGIYASAFTNASGTASLVFDTPTLTTDELYITVTGYNTSVYQSNIMSGSTQDGIVSFDADVYSCSQTAVITLIDADLEGAGTHSVNVSSTTNPSGISVQLTETETDGIFTGTVLLGTDIAVSHNDTVTVTYYDADTGDGSPQYKTDTASIDCMGPVISGIEVTAVGGNFAEISFLTSEGAISSLIWGTSCANLPNTADASTAYSTEHSGIIDGLLPGTKYYYRVQAQDAVGNTSLSACYSFTTANEMVIGNGTATINQAPLYTYYHDNRTQIIYQTSDLGTSPFTIASLAIDVIALPGLTMNNFTIRMKHTTKNDYETSAVFEATGWTVVYQSNQSIAETGWFSFDLSQPFDYNGTENLMVDISFDNSSWVSQYGRCNWTPTSTKRAIYAYTDSYNGNPLNWAPGNTPTVYTTNNMLNLKLGIITEDEEDPETEPALISFNADFPAIYSWKYSFSKSIVFGMKGSTWNPVLNGSYAEKMQKGDITGDGNIEIVAYFPGFGLYYYDFIEWIPIMENTVLDFALLQLEGSASKELYASFDGYGVFKWNFSKGHSSDDNPLTSRSWTRIIESPAYIMIAVDIDKDMDEDLIMSFNAEQGIYRYNPSVGQLTKMLSVSMKDAVKGDFTGDGINELIISFDGYGIYVLNYTRDLKADRGYRRLSTDKEGFADLRSIFFDNIWYYNRGYQYMRIVPVSSDTGSRMATGNISGDARDEIITVIQGWTYYYSPQSQTWTKLAETAFERIGSGFFTDLGNDNEDLIVSCSQLGRIYLYKSASGSFEQILEGLTSSSIINY